MLTFGLVYFERRKNSEQGECIFMQLNSNSSPRAPNETRKAKKRNLVKISKNTTDKVLANIFIVSIYLKYF